MHDFDPLKSDTYTKHLGNINQEKGVIARNDIYNQNGAILVRAGENLNNGTIDKLLQHRLMKPIHENVQIQDSHTGEALYKKIIEFINQHDDLIAMHNCHGIDKSLKTMCNIFAKEKTLQQVITVLSMQLPDIFQQACFCAWISVCLCKYLQMSPTESIAIFQAALCHDIGLLHIPTELIFKNEPYTHEEWRHIQTHPVIGQIVAKSIPGLHKITPRAILEHHECCDGTGFPQGKTENKLSLGGQMIALCDAIYPLRFNKNYAGSLKNLHPFLQLNHTTHMHDNYMAMVAVINQAELSIVRTIKETDIPEFCQSLLKKYDLLTVWADTINSTMKIIPDTANEKAFIRGQKIYLHIVYIVKSSGLFNLGIKRWITHLSKTPMADSHIELEEINLMYSEVLRHIKNLSQQIIQMHDELMSHNDTTLNDSTTLLSSLSEEKLPEEIKNKEVDIEKIL